MPALHLHTRSPSRSLPCNSPSQPPSVPPWMTENHRLYTAWHRKGRGDRNVHKELSFSPLPAFLWSLTLTAEFLKQHASAVACETSHKWFCFTSLLIKSKSFCFNFANPTLKVHSRKCGNVPTKADVPFSAAVKQKMCPRVCVRREVGKSSRKEDFHLLRKHWLIFQMYTEHFWN